MYAEVYKWFTETSGEGLMNQTALIMHPKAASKEEDIADAVEAWESMINRMAMYGEDHR